MQLDPYSNPIFNEQDIFDALYAGHRITPNDIVFIDSKNESILSFEENSSITLSDPIIEYGLSLNELDRAYQGTWNMPKEYHTLDIEQWLDEQCPPWDPNYTRLKEELAAFKERNMLDLLKWLKYFVDTCSKNNVVWGLGRGSSVASYVLYLIGVHSIDPIKFNLDWQEFLR
jgi:hypothetical protein